MNKWRQSPIIGALALFCMTHHAWARERLSMDQGWLFIREDAKGADAPNFDDKTWRKLDVPHDWSIEGPYDQRATTGGQGGYVPAGIGWYRKHFVTPTSFANQRVTIQFDGVYMNADVWVNGKQVGHQPFGYTSFVCDVTDALAAAGKENVVAVRVDNSVQPNSRWYTGSGIYRHVWADVTGPVHVAPWGTYVTTPKVTAESATVQVAMRWQNDGDQAGGATITHELVDAQGKVFADAINTVDIAAKGEKVTVMSMTLAQPQLWSVEKPTMYTVRTRLNVPAVTGGTHALLDSYETPIGIRSIQYDVEKGFLLNGQHVKMLGMCLHHDGGAFGAAVPEEVWERRLTLLKGMGCNAIRCSHNPPAPEFLDLCDRLGILVMDEAFDEWTSAKGQLRGSYSSLFQEWSQKDLLAMLHRDRNHPSVVMWSVGNEIPQQAAANGPAILKALVDTCHAEDPTRPVTSGCDNIHAPNPTRPEFLALLDIAGYNYVDRWGDHREIFFSDDRQKYPERKFVGTEDVCVGGVRGSYFGGFGAPPLVPATAAAAASVPADAARGGFAGRGFGDGRAGGLGGTGYGYAASMIRAEQLWKFNATHDYVIGYFMWTGIDYLGEAGAWPRKGSGSGVIDTCGFPKDGYYFYQSQWTRAPMVHILPHWNFPGERGTVIPVVVYSNCQQVELQVNGKSFGTKSLVFPRPGAVRSWSDPTPAGTTGDLHLTWDVPWEPGTVRAIGRRGGQIVAQEEIRTAGPAATIALKADKTGMEAGKLAHIEVRILDTEGNFVPSANHAITFEVEGPGKVIAMDNGDQSSHDPYQGISRNAFNGMCLGVVKAAGEGHLVIRAKADGLKAGVVELDIKPAPKVATLP